jgi:WD40 repeat protein/tRNA A-37 threonylcarbamoyl transferase component Bud32
VAEQSPGRSGKCSHCGRTFPLPHSGDGGGETASFDCATPAMRSASEHRVGQMIGRFEIRSHLGAGGFGDVYRALDTLLKRDVALKLPRAGVFASASERVRFLRESQAAAQLRHPNIVPTYDAGLEGEQFYIALAFIDGESLQSRLEDGRPDFRQAAGIVISLAEALDYAHCQGIVHRDVKPANIMLDAKGEPLLMDFGLARLREAEDQLTHDGTVLGTPAYMAPEQAAARHDEVGPASDQYSLGVVLYELLCGQRPFEGSAAAVISMVIDQEAPPPRAHNRAIPRDLDTICVKAMAKRPADRYVTCQQLAEDLRRWLNNEPIRARRVRLPERLARWIGREPVVAAMASSLAVALIVGTVVSIIFAARARNEAVRAEKNAGDAEKSAQRAGEKTSEALYRLYLAEFAKIQSAWEERDYPKIQAALRAATPDPGAPDFRGWEWYYFQTLNQEPLRTFEVPGVAEPYDLAWHPAGDRFATGGGARPNYGSPILSRVRIWNAATGQLIRECSTPACNPVWSPDGSRLAAAMDHGAIVWNSSDGAEVARIDKQKFPVWALAWSPDGTRLAWGSSDYDYEIRDRRGEYTIWDVAQRKEAFSKTTTPSGVTAIGWSSDGTRLAIGFSHSRSSEEDPDVTVINAADGAIVKHFKGASQGCNRVAWSPDGRELATNRMSFSGNPIDVWDVATGKKLRTLDNGGVGMLWSAQANQLAGLAPHGRGFLVKLWEPDRGARRTVLWLPGSGYQSSMDWDKSATRLATLSQGPVAKTARLNIWGADQLRADHMSIDVHGPTTISLCVAWGPKGERCASGGTDGTVWIFDAASGGKPLNIKAHTAGVTWLAWSRRRNQILSLGGDGYIKRWNPTTGNEDLPLRLDDKTKRIKTAALAPGENEVLVAVGESLEVVQVDDGKARPLEIRPSGDIRAMAWHPDGKTAAVACEPGGIKLVDVRAGREVWSQKFPAAVVTALAFDGDGSTLASGDASGMVQLIDSRTGASRRALAAHNAAITGAAWTRNPARLATADSKGTIFLWEPRYGSALLRIRDTVYSPGDFHRDTALTGLEWSPDGSGLAASGQDDHFREGHGLVHVWWAIPHDHPPIPKED